MMNALKDEETIFECIPEYRGTFNLGATICIIKWEKVRPISPIKLGILSTAKLIHVNVYKMLYDIGSCLQRLHEAGFVHGDPSVDNMGINDKGNFILFDFDFASRITFFNKSSLDYYKLKRSLLFYLNELKDDVEVQNEDIVSKVNEIISAEDRLVEMLILEIERKFNISHSDAFVFLKALKLQN